MRHIKLKYLLQENQSQQWMREALDKDLEYLQEVLIQEGLWDTIKQKVGGFFEKGSNKAKEFLIKPLIKVIMNKIAKDDPEGFAKVQQYVKQDPNNVENILDHPNVKQQQAKIEKELRTSKDNLTEQEADDFIQEYIDAVLEEAKVLRDDPRNVKRRERYAQRKAARAAGTTTGGTTGTATVGGTSDTTTGSGASTTNVNVDAGNKPKKKKKSKEPSATDDISKGAAQLGRGLAKGADKLGIAAIEKTGDFVAGAGDLIKKGLNTSAGKAVKGAVGGLISKVYNWAKSHPKITAAVGFGLLGLLLTVASIGSGGIVPLILGTATAGGIGAMKGAAVGSAIGAGREMYKQIKGGTKSFKNMDWKKIAVAAKDGLFTGGKYGFIIGAGAHIAGQAFAGLQKMTAATAKATGDVALTNPSVTRSDWINNPQYAVKGQYNMVVEFNDTVTKFRVPSDVYQQVMNNYGVNPTLPIKDPETLSKAVQASQELLSRYNAGEFLKTSTGLEGIKQSFFKVGGEIVTPGNPLTQNQLNAMKMAMDMGNDGNKLYGAELMKQYNAWIGK